jgi:hypothetical protein
MQSASATSLIGAWPWFQQVEIVVGLTKLSTSTTRIECASNGPGHGAAKREYSRPQRTAVS